MQNGTFATIIPGVQNGRFAVGQDNFGVTKAREQVVDFATYLSDGQAFLGSQSVPVDKVGSVADLCGLTLATSPGSTFQQILEANARNCAAAGKKPYTVQYFADTGPIFLGLSNGKVDVYFGPTLSLRYDATHVPNTKFLGQISSTPVGFVTAKGSPLAKSISDAVNKLIADGTYQKIFDNWALPAPASTVPRSTRPPPSERCAMASTTPLAVLDLVPISSGSTAAEALRNSIDLTQQAERSGTRATGSPSTTSTPVSPARRPRS